MECINVYTVKNKAEAEELDALLWRELWQPLGLDRNIRHKFKVEGKEIELVAKLNEQIIGGLVAIQTSDKEIELRHIAVSSNAQRKGAGRALVNKLISIASSKNFHKIRTIARNTSVDFFRAMGFQTTTEEPPEHPVFLKHGITFEIMEKELNPIR